MTDDPKIYVSNSRNLIDVGKIVTWVQSSYWGGWQKEEQIRRAVHNSMVFGAFISGPEGHQIGFARVVSDHASFSAVTDVYVDEPWRKKGVGRMLMQCVLEHPSIQRSITILRTRDVNAPFYAKFGFVAVGGGLMQLNPTK